MGSVNNWGGPTDTTAAVPFGGVDGWAEAVAAVLNNNDTPLDQRIANLVGQALPIGTVVAYGGSSAPVGWHLCDGTAHGSSQLAALVGPNTPDLRDRFVVGAGAAYTKGDTGGAASVTLTGAQSGVAAHAHTASSGTESADHSHSGTTAANNVGHVHYADPPATWSGTMNQNATHTHGAVTYEGITTGDSNRWIDTADAASPETQRDGTVTIQAANTNHQHLVDIAGFNTGGQSANHTHTVTTGGRSAAHTHAITVNDATAATAAQSHENRPPFYALTYIIRKGTG